MENELLNTGLSVAAMPVRHIYPKSQKNDTTRQTKPRVTNMNEPFFKKTLHVAIWINFP